MISPTVFLYPWVPWTITLLVLLVVVLLVLAGGAKRRRWKITLGLSALVVVLASYTGLVVASSSAQAPLVNVPAPVPSSLSLAFSQYAYPNATVETFNARTGARRWQQSLSNTAGSLAADAHTLYLTTGTAVMALRASDGKQLWQTPLNPPVFSQDQMLYGPILADGMVYVSVFSRAGGGVIYALHARDGVQAWHLYVNGDSWAAGAGLVFVGWSTGYTGIVAYRSSDGRLVWSRRVTPDEAQYPIVRFVAGGVVYVTGWKQILALHASDGTRLWLHLLTSPLPRPLVNQHLGIGASSIYFELEELTANGDFSYLYCLNAQTGQIRWKAQVLSTLDSSAVEAGDLVYFVNGLYLDALRVSDGQRVWRHSSNRDAEFGNPLVVNNVLFVQSFVLSPRLQSTCPPECEPSEAVNALNATTGSPYWRSALPSIDPVTQLVVSDSSPGG